MEADRTMSTSAWDLLEQAYEEARHFYFYNVAADVYYQSSKEWCSWKHVHNKDPPTTIHSPRSLRWNDGPHTASVVKGKLRKHCSVPFGNHDYLGRDQEMAELTWTESLQPSEREKKDPVWRCPLFIQKSESQTHPWELLVISSSLFALFQASGTARERHYEENGMMSGNWQQRLSSLLPKLTNTLHSDPRKLSRSQ